jgi:phosphoenolpyruvate synthase/pyruvate phosphate dikinase
MADVIWLAECTDECVDLVGGKATGLGRLLRNGFLVPAGFAISARAYRDHVERNGMQAEIERLLANPAEQAAEQIRTVFENSRPAGQLAEEVRHAYQELGGAELPVAVRSSATLEDLAEASFAGQQESYLWLIGAEQVLQHVVRCWGSLFTPQAIAYRGQHAMPMANLAMGVVVQRMVPAEAAGVMLTIDPTNGDRSAITLEASYGLGVAVVNGEVTPDRFSVDKVTLEIRSRTLGDKHIAYGVDPAVQGTRAGPVLSERRGQLCLSDAEVIALAEMGKRMERAMGGRAQDIEWAIGAGREIMLLQARPETVWSRQSATQLTQAGASVMQRILGAMTPPSEVSGKY